MELRCTGVRPDAEFSRAIASDRPRLEPDFSTADGAPNCAQDPQHDTDHHKDSADGVQDRDPCEITDQEKNDTEHDHGHPIRCVGLCKLADKELPVPSKFKLCGRWAYDS
jgi:hypothetical protein